MSCELAVSRSDGSVQISWNSLNITKKQTKNSVWLVYLRDRSCGFEWVSSPLGGRSRSVKLAVHQLWSCPASHQFEVSVCRCEQLYPYTVPELYQREQSFEATVPQVCFEDHFSSTLRLRPRNAHIPEPFRKPCLSVCQPTYSLASVRWRTRGPRPNLWMIRLTKTSEGPETGDDVFTFVDGHADELLLPVRLMPGNEYKVCVRALSEVMRSDCTASSKPYYQMFAEGKIYLRTAYTINDLQILRQLATGFCGHYVVPCNWFYRNKSVKYFKNILNKQRGIMKVYDKDYSGDPASPINGEIQGLFFMTLNIYGEPPFESPFGPRRLQVPCHVLLKEAPNLYFADFYCMKGSIHYVTLVMTSPGSPADEFCASHLPYLSMSDPVGNPFLFRIGGVVYVNSTRNFLVEVLYTNDINVGYLLQYAGARIVDVPTICKGSSTPGGVPKNIDCAICNLPVPNDFPFF